MSNAYDHTKKYELAEDVTAVRPTVDIYDLMNSMNEFTDNLKSLLSQYGEKEATNNGEGEIKPNDALERDFEEFGIHSFSGNDYPDSNKSRAKVIKVKNANIIKHQGRSVNSFRNRKKNCLKVNKLKGVTEIKRRPKPENKNLEYYENQMSMEFNAKEYKKQLMNSDSIEDVKKVPLPIVRDDQNYMFISYAHKDYKQVYSDLADMYESGALFWYDGELYKEAGINWDVIVQSKIEDSHCVGVIFYMSQNAFLSKSVNREIKCLRTSNKDASAGKISANSFFVNLTDKEPSEILQDIIKTMDDNKWEQIGFNMERLGNLASTFGDDRTYLKYTSPWHKQELVGVINKYTGVSR